MTTKTRRFSIKAVGDICFHGIGGDPFVHVASQLQADLLFGNLECCLTTREDSTKNGVAFSAAPGMARYLADTRFDVVCLANNHVLDYGPDGLEDTISALEENEIFYVGAGRKETEATATRTLDCDGVRVAVVSSVDAAGGDTNRPTVSVLSVKAMAQRIRGARARADIVIASYHGGIELDTLPTPFIVRSFRMLVDAGADLVLGHHPHVLQPAEIYNNRVIAYSLGNFVFDNRRYGAHADLASTSTILDIKLTMASTTVVRSEYHYRPVRIGADYLPIMLTDDTAGEFHTYMEGLERKLAAIKPDGMDVERLQNITSAVHKKSLRTLLRYGMRHIGDFTLKELVVGGWMVIRGMVRRGSQRGKTEK